jgi:hypothetical protein
VSYFFSFFFHLELTFFPKIFLKNNFTGLTIGLIFFLALSPISLSLFLLLHLKTERGNSKKILVRPSVNFVQSRPTLVAKKETRRALIARQDGRQGKAVRNVKLAEVEHTVTGANHARKDTQEMEPITMLLNADSATWVKRRPRLVLRHVNDGKYFLSPHLKICIEIILKR